MGPFSIDPSIAELGASLTAATVRNTAKLVNDKIRAIKAKRNDQEQISELEQIVYELIDDKNELARIAQAYEQELVAQQISDDDIEYIVDTVIPVLKDLTERYIGSIDADEAAKMRATLDAMTGLLSVKTLTMLQLLGFNFKRAIGEPLTFLIQKLITSRIPVDPKSALEVGRLNTTASLELLKVAQDEEATERWERLRDFRNPES